MDYRDGIRGYIDREREVIGLLDIDKIDEVMNLLLDTACSGRAIYIMGNGGSAATASHFVCDFAKGVALCKGVPFRMICLSDNVPSLTAIANDIGYDQVFLFQLKGKLLPGDAVVAISGSGNSENVVLAAKYAQEQGASVIGLTGYSGGKLKQLSDYNLHVPVDNMQIVEDVHMMLDHMMMYVICNS